MKISENDLRFPHKAIFRFEGFLDFDDHIRGFPDMFGQVKDLSACRNIFAVTEACLKSRTFFDKDLMAGAHIG